MAKKVPTIVDVAKLANVGTMSVSRYFKDRTLVSEILQERIFNAAENLDYTPNQFASSLASQKSNIIPIYIPYLRFAAIHFMRSIHKVLKTKGYQNFLVSNDDLADESKIFRDLLRWKPQGIIVVGNIVSQDIRKKLKLLNIPVVETARPMGNVSSISEFDVVDSLGGGELGVLVAPAGIGKSWCLQSLGAHLVRQGNTVAHYTLELNANYVGLRYDTVFSGTPTANVKFYQEDVQKVIDTLTGKLIIKYYPTRSATVNTLAAHLKQMEIQEIKPDVVIVDYADILKPTTFYKEKRHATGETYENLRGMAGEFDIPIWTASQANRSSLEEEVIDASKVSEDYSKVMTADFVMSVSRKVEDKIANTGRFHVIKNRFGIDGITFPANINTNTGLIQVHEASTVGGKSAQGKMDNSEEYLRKTLSQKYKDMEGFE